MGRITIRHSTRTVRKSKTTTDKSGRVHCKTCGAFIGNKGRKKK